MARGRKKGETKSRILIKDDLLAPYYITQDERQYVLMKEGNTLGQGYFGDLSNAITKATQLLMLVKGEDTVTLKEYIQQYENIKSQITNAVQL